MNSLGGLPLACVALCLAPALAIATPPASARAAASSFVTLGTGSGPLSNPQRAQPSNLLRHGSSAVLIDAGEGVTDQLGKAGASVGDIQAIFISHLHFDHTGGLFGFLGRRYQVRVGKPLTIFGPPGTRSTVKSLLHAMQPMAEANGRVSSWISGKPGDGIKVVEMIEGSDVRFGVMRVRSTVNSHYVLSDKDSEGAHSLSYRFDLPDRSIFFTGDTGPSVNVEKLAKGVDLLVSEVMDLEGEMADVRRQRPDLGSVARWAVKRHFTRQHLQPGEAGRLAQAAGARSLLLTHIAIKPDSLEHARDIIAGQYPGPITFAVDLQSY